MTTMTGKAMTVAGPVEPDQLGFTLMHEHLYLDLRKNHWPDPDSTATELDSWFTPLDLSNLHLARHALPLVDNYLLSSEADAIAEVSDFARLGGGTLVDVTSRGLRRDVPAIARTAEAAGINIVLGSGWYQKLFHPEDMGDRSVESLTDEIVRDITDGIPGTGVRSGIIGEIGVNGDPITPNEDKNIRAAARASVATGAAISFHSPPRKDEKRAVLDIVEEEGADLTRVILGHSDHMADDLPYMLSLLEKGVCIQFDTLGVVRTYRDGPRPHRRHRHPPAHRGRARRPHPALPGRMLEDAPQEVRRRRLHLHPGNLPAIPRGARSVGVRRPPHHGRKPQASAYFCGTALA